MYFNPKTDGEMPVKTVEQSALQVDFESKRVRFSTIRNKADNKPQPATFSFKDLTCMLTLHAERGSKDGLAFVPAVFKEGSTRASANVELMTMLVLDIDDGTPYSEMLPKLEPFAHVFHTSHSHTPNFQKYRVVVFLDQPIPTAEWHGLWLRANQYFGHMDPATKDPARLYFLPAHPPGAAEFKSSFHPGKLLRPDDLPPLAPEVQKKIAQAKASIDRVTAGYAHSGGLVEFGIEEGFESELNPAIGLQAVVKRCKFMQFASHPDHQSKLSEPEWMAMITNACGFEQSEAWIHAASESHDSYDELDTQGRINRYRDQGYLPTTCERIRELGFTGCPAGGCKTSKGDVVKAPAGLWGWSFQREVLAPSSEVTQPNKVRTQPKKKLGQEYATEFAEANHKGHVAAFCNQVLAYIDGHWKALNPDVEIKKPLLQAMGIEATAAKVNGVLDLLRIKYATEPELFERNSPLICLNNGTLNPMTGDLLPHSPENYLTNKLAINFDDKADCSLWLQTLDEIFAPDEDKAQKIQLLQEFMGYCMIPDTRLHQFLWLVGTGGNGKSLILAVLTALIGKTNISYAQIERLQEKFVRAELQGKLVNISSEMSAQATVADGYLKQITSGDIIEAERKNEKPFSFKPYARLVGATNVLPRLLDHSDGFFRRAMIIRFNRQFSGAERDNLRETKLLAELPGILNWALAGLQRLLDRGEYVIPSSSEREIQQYRVNSDPVRQFSDEFLRRTDDKGRWVQAGVLYQHYVAWSRDNGYKTLASNQFAERLSGVGIGKTKTGAGRFWHAEFVLPGNGEPLPTISPLAQQYQV